MDSQLFNSQGTLKDHDNDGGDLPLLCLETQKCLQTLPTVPGVRSWGRRAKSPPAEKSYLDGEVYEGGGNVFLSFTHLLCSTGPET